MRSSYEGKRVLVTGHTGFKGGWLSLWLSELGARVFGYSLAPTTTPNLFSQARLAATLDDARGDIRDRSGVADRLDAVKPDFVFHLAAQSLVRPSYDDPVGTMETNVMGTVNVLDAVRRAGRRCVVVVVTTDKCYENTGQLHGYRETDPLGGADPYSASKACAEIVTSAFTRSFFHSAHAEMRVATGRAGNVIGGGDYATDRLLPDLVRATEAGAPLQLRLPDAVRPWQHVLEALSGYLWLGAQLASDHGRELVGGWNFAPESGEGQTVLDIAKHAIRVLGRGEIEIGEPDPSRSEKAVLTLSADKARRELGWSATWDVTRAVEETMHWYRAVSAGTPAHDVSLSQIRSYVSHAKARGLGWAR